MESMQNTGSFKIRGATYQIHQASEFIKPGQTLITFSGGNYGKAFATVTNHLKIPSLVMMPETAPKDRIGLIEDLGSTVEVHQYSKIDGLIKQYVKEQDMIFLSPFDDINLIKGHGSITLEILDTVKDPDIVIVPCGGGGLLAGIAACFRAAGLVNTKIYGVEPDTADTMFRSFQIGKPASLQSAHSIANGLVPLRAGDFTYPFCKRHVDEIVRVSDEEIRRSVRSLANLGFIVEPSGAAALAALQAVKIPTDLSEKKIIVVISGRNITLEYLQSLVD